VLKNLLVFLFSHIPVKRTT